MNHLADPLRSNERQTAILAALLVAAMMACMAAGLVRMFEWLGPGWGGRFLPWFAFLVSLEALYSQRRLKNTVSKALLYRAAEWVLILALLRLVASLQHGWQGLLADLPGWQADFAANFLEVEFVMGAIILGLVWGISLWCGADLLELEGDAELMAAESLEGLTSNRGLVQRQLASHVFGVGGGLVFLAALVRLDLSSVTGAAPLQGGGSLYVLIYFLLCLGLLSLTHLASRRAAWAWERVTVRSEMTGRWLVFSLAFLAVVTGIAILLPTRDTVGLFPALAYLAGLLLALFLGLMALILTPLFLIASFLLGLFGLPKPSKPTAPTLEELMPAATEIAQESGGGSALWQALQSVLFWVVLVVIVVVALVLFVQQNKMLMQHLRRLRGMDWLGRAWQRLVAWLRAGTRQAPQALRAGLERLWRRGKRLAGPEIGSRLHLRRLTPRQQVLFYYLALVRRGGEGGVPRHPADTPADYARSLRAGLETDAEAVDTLTERFIEARYRPQPVDVQQAGLARRAWERLRRALRKKTHPE